MSTALPTAIKARREAEDRCWPSGSNERCVVKPSVEGDVVHEKPWTWQFEPFSSSLQAVALRRAPMGTADVTHAAKAPSGHSHCYSCLIQCMLDAGSYRKGLLLVITPRFSSCDSWTSHGAICTSHGSYLPWQCLPTAAHFLLPAHSSHKRPFNYSSLQ